MIIEIYCQKEPIQNNYNRIVSAHVLELPDVVVPDVGGGADDRHHGGLHSAAPHHPAPTLHWTQQVEFDTISIDISRSVSVSVSVSDQYRYIYFLNKRVI